MNTIVKKVDYLDSGLAASFCGSNFKAIDKSFLKEYKKRGVIKVVLKTKNAWGKTIQKTYYCLKY